MKLLDLFSGIGGFHKGLKQAGFNFNWVGYSDVNKYANSVYRRHYKDAKKLGAIETIQIGKLPKIDIVTFGWPCQDNSIAGKRKGQRNGTRSSLLYKAIDIIRAKKPRCFLAENVKGLYSVNDGFDFIESIRLLAYLSEDLPQYDIECQLLNTRWFLPQNRERIYFVGHLRGEPRSEIFPLGETNKTYIENNRERRIIFNGKSLWDRVYTTNGSSVALRANGGGKGAKTGMYYIPVLTPDRQEKRQNGRRFKTDGEPSFTLTSQDIHGVIEVSRTIRAGGIGSPPKSKQNWDTIEAEGRIRRLTPLECERLQGFPDNWTQYEAGGEKISDTQRYKLIGNAVSVPCVEAIGRKLIKCA